MKNNSNPNQISSEELDGQQDYFLDLALKLLSNNESLEEILPPLIRFVEVFSHGAMCTVLFLNKTGTRFEKVFAPSFTDSFNQKITQLDIGEMAGSCGRAAYLGERVVVEDIHSSPYWTKYLSLAEDAQVDSCWSQPIKNSVEKVIGTFAIYYKSTHVPSARDIRLIEQAARLVSIVFHQLLARKMLSKSRDEVSLIYNSAIDAMWLIDVEDQKTFRFKSVNDAFINVTGHTREDVLEKTVDEVLPPSSIPLVHEKYNLAVTTGEVVDYVEVAPLPNGIKVGQIRVKPIKNERGLVTKILGIAEDITEKQQIYDLLQEREDDLVYAQHVAQLGSWKWDVKTGQVKWSKGIYDILGLDSSKPPMPYEEQVKLYSDESWNKLNNAVSEALQNGTAYKLDIEARDLQNPRWFVARGEVTNRDSHGKVIGLAGTLQDITDRKKLENNLTQALKSRDEFIAVATHELKTPLTTLLLALHSAVKNVFSSEKDKLLSRLEKIKSQGERLDALINNLLDVTSIGAGKMRLEMKPDVNFSTIVEGELKKYEDQITKLGLKLTKDIAPSIIGVWDASRLEQIVTNLLTNAVKYGDGKPVEITLRQVGLNACLEVKDHGIGIAIDKQDKIFERFERAVSETNYKGLGLGLWIVKEIVIAFGGQIKVQSVLGKGSTFTVELPIKVEK